MANWMKALLFGGLIAIITHVAAIAALPNVIMNVALKKIATTATGVNTLYHGQMVTPQNQTIVRSSPDLAYTTCVLDLSDGPVRIFVGKGQDYVSAAFYGANTDNVFTLNDRNIGPAGARILVQAKGKQVQAQRGEVVVTLPSKRGLLLVRRLAPNSEVVTRVLNERALDSCSSEQVAQK
jgi:uncharacterized membrane protein